MQLLAAWETQWVFAWESQYQNGRPSDPLMKESSKEAQANACRASLLCRARHAEPASDRGKGVLKIRGGYVAIHM